MRPEELPHEARQSLEVLCQTIKDALEDALGDYLRVISRTSVPEDYQPGRSSITGSWDLCAPEIEESLCDKNLLLAQHKAIYKSAHNVYGHNTLKAVIIRGKRASVQAPWELETRLVSVEEYRQILGARKLFDPSVREELQQIMNAVENAERVSFGRSNYNKPIELIRKIHAVKGVERLEPTPHLLEIFGRVEKIYRDHALEPVVLDWTLRSPLHYYYESVGAFTFDDYFE